MPGKVRKCMVQECKYNQGFECLADEIEVQSQRDAITSGVSTSSHTLCQTFAPKDQSDAASENPGLSL